MGKHKFHELDHNTGLFIYEQMLQAHNECSDIVEQNHNIVSIFFHDLMRITTNYFYKKNALYSIYTPPKNVLEKEVSAFPYISYKDVENGIDLERKKFALNNRLGFKKTSWNLFVELYFSIIKNIKTVGFGENIPVKNEIAINFLKNKIKVKFLRNNGVAVKEVYAQLQILKKYIGEICSNLDANEVSNSLFLLIERHIKGHVSKYDHKIKCDLVVVGSLSEKTNQLNAVIANRLKTPVLTMFHGEGDQSIYDEPRFGYCEMVFVDYILGHGSLNSYNTKNSKYLNSVILNNPIYIPSSSDFIKSIYNGGAILPIDNLSKFQWMYVPDSLQFVSQWGPYGGYINDMLYLKWQKSVVSAFPNLVYKRHPKGNVLFREMSNNELEEWINPNHRFNVTITSENFYNIYNDCDGYVFDTVSTAFMVAVATDKPIIYFNIGKRNFRKDVKKKIKERCLWIDHDPEDDINFDEISKKILNFNGINRVTELYSLDLHNEYNDRGDVLLNFIDHFDL